MDSILALDPAPAVRVRLLRDVLGVSAQDAAFAEAYRQLEGSRWVRRLAGEQLKDGSWGRLHSVDTKNKQSIGTTEVGVERALALGLEAAHPILRRAQGYLLGVLESGECHDPPEKNERWPVGARLFAAATLALIAPNRPQVISTGALWLEIVRRAFSGGSYDPQAEDAACYELTGVHSRGTYLEISNRYALGLLAARAGDVPEELSRKLLAHLWGLAEGIRYLTRPLDHLPDLRDPGAVEYWLRSLELLSPLPGWSEAAAPAIRWIMEHQGEDGFWDFGPRHPNSVLLPLAENWRASQTRRIDWTTRILLLLENYHGE